MKKVTTINLRENRDIWQVLNTTFTFIGIVFKPLYRDLLLLTCPFYIISSICFALPAYDTLNTFSRNPFSLLGSSGGLYQFASPMYWVGVLFMLIGWSLSCAVVGNHLLQYRLHGANYNPADVRRGLIKDMFRYIGAFLLNYLIVIAASFLFFIPGIYLLVANTLVTSIIILEKNMDLVDAFSESRRLIRDNWWWSFLLGMVISIIIYGLRFGFMVPAIVLNVIIWLNTLKGDETGPHEVLFIIFNAITYFGYAVIAPVMIISSSVYYYSLREKKDHVALFEGIDNIGVQVAQSEAEIKEDEGDF